jgi:hypothetical protein
MFVGQPTSINHQVFFLMGLAENYAPGFNDLT